MWAPVLYWCPSGAGQTTPKRKKTARVLQLTELGGACRQSTKRTEGTLRCSTCFWSLIGEYLAVYLFPKEKSDALFRVQDAHRPVFVLAEDLQDALAKWRDMLTTENDGIDDFQDDYPSGIEFLADDGDVILGADTANPALDACRQVLARLERNEMDYDARQVLREAIAKTERK